MSSDELLLSVFPACKIGNQICHEIVFLLFAGNYLLAVSYAEVPRLLNPLTKPNHHMLQQDLPQLQKRFCSQFVCFAQSSFCCTFLVAHRGIVFF